MIFFIYAFYLYFLCLKSLKKSLFDKSYKFSETLSKQFLFIFFKFQKIDSNTKWLKMK